ncbi:type III secretion system export apparatus subunit SctT [Desulfocurvus vexinensis]|uniref:type III secretion system export apparatus subunit SctT n=1 Tax=Desulfocurvus vexinensis TaxID=399548 RepID=UPI0004B8DB48|nr:type III secretion system export apparatus subunit SctT [Desulfocurvus vexinensis]
MAGLAQFLADVGMENLLTATTLGLPRIVALFTVVPFLGGGVVTGALRMTLALPLAAFLFPLLPTFTQVSAGRTPDETTLFIIALMAKEIFIGLALGYLVSILFWAVESAGFFIDNQRGGSSAQMSDPMSQDQTSPTGSLLFQAMVFLFYTSGGFVAFLGMLFSTYALWPVGELLPWPDNLAFPMLFAGQFGVLFLYVVLLSAPLVIVCFLSDFCLGLINRFAQQLNVFVLSMGVKSAITAVLLFLYFFPLCYILLELMAHIPTLHLTLDKAFGQPFARLLPGV